MITAQELESQQNISQDIIFPPGDLYSDEPPVEIELHLEQIMFLVKCIKWLWKDGYDFYAAVNLTIYYSPNQKKQNISGIEIFL
jgi:Uma2 family endonuclease